ncbi:MAG: hypothetical protein IPL84_02730 [Chitinophagaceae bacterium]|nr:hypothetical protein [Chitinophagaceae bacterium]
MKKQFLLAALMTLGGVGFYVGSENNVKACDTGIASCLSIMEKPVLDNSIRERIENYISPGYPADTRFDRLLNPLVNL